MSLDFDMEAIKVIEFGVGGDAKEDWQFVIVSVDGDVKMALQDMLRATWTAMRQQEPPALYQPSEKYSSTEYLYVKNNSDLATVCQQLHSADNLPINTNALRNVDGIRCYFAQFTDHQQRRLTAVRRAGYFKGILNRRLVRFVNDSLKIEKDNIFKLDTDFDILIDSERIHVWRPNAYEFIDDLKQAVLDAVPINVAAIQQNVPFIDFEHIREYAMSHSRAARYLASIRSQNLPDIERHTLTALCRDTGVVVKEVDERLQVEDRHIMGFLEVLDCRRYVAKFGPNTKERFRATSRQRIP